MPVLVATDCPMVARQSFMLRGITPLLLSDMRNSHLICVEDSCSIDDDEAPELVLTSPRHLTILDYMFLPLI
jgi:hypothetical protein